MDKNEIAEVKENIADFVGGLLSFLTVVLKLQPLFDKLFSKKNKNNVVKKYDEKK